MPYIGRTPLVGAYQKCDALNASATADYTLQVSSTNVVPESVNHMIVSLNGVIQSPTTAYTVSGATLSFASALTSNDTIDFVILLGNVLDIGTPSDGTVTSAKLSGALVTPSTLDVNGNELFLDADADTSITADTDDEIDFKTGGSDRAIITSTGLGIGNAAPSVTLSVGDDDDGGQGVVGKKALISQTLDTTYNTSSDTFGGLHLNNNNSATDNRTGTGLTFTHGTGGVAGISSTSTASSRADLRFITRGAGDTIAERMTITDDGNVLVGTTDTNPSANNVAGTAILSSGFISVSKSGDVGLELCRKTNDGNLINFRQEGTIEGTISVSSTTVSYNGFTGTHWSRFTDNSKPTILRGTVLETLDEMCDWYNLEFNVTTTTQDEDGNDVINTITKKIPHVLADGQSNGDVITYNHEGTDVQATIVKEGDIKHMKAKVSDTTDAKNVYGLFVAYDLDGEGYNDFYVASVGSFVVRIKADETIAKGDLLQSNGDGTAKVQSDDNVKSSSFAKILSTTKIETYDDGSFIVPCSLRC